MNVSPPSINPGAGLLADDDVIVQLHQWQSAGQRAALVTLVGIDGVAPRPVGAQMAVAADGTYAGYLSGGCLEQSVALEAQAVIADGRNKLVRYGKGSPYFDVKLPCGSGLDLYFDQGIDAGIVAELLTRRRQRQTCALRTGLSSGSNTVENTGDTLPLEHSVLRDGGFTRVYPVPLKLVLLGHGPALAGMATLAQATGIELTISTSDGVTRTALDAAGIGNCINDDLEPGSLAELDAATAAVLCFHDHGNEPDLLFHMLKSASFYIGALGNHGVHRERLAVLAARGFSRSDLARIHAPVGSISGAKSKATFAIGVLAEVLSKAKAMNLVA